MTLPPEILDKILGYIPTDNEGRQTLVACALVATWWMELSQGRLLSLVSINNDNHQRWMDSVISSPSKAHLLQYVRSLLHRRGAFGFGYRMQNLPLHSGEYLLALRNLHSLTLSKIRIEHIGEEEFHTCFSAFRETLTFLSLKNFVASFSAFITLVDYFPNIRTLQLREFRPEPNDGPVPSLSRPLQGKVHVCSHDSDSFEWLDWFAGLDLEYEELVVTSFSFTGTRFVESALQISARTVNYLRLTAEFERK